MMGTSQICPEGPNHKFYLETGITPVPLNPAAIAVEQKWRISDSQGYNLALTFEEKVSKIF